MIELILCILGLLFSIYFLYIVLYDKFKTKKHPNPNYFIFIALLYVIGFLILLIKLLI